MTRPAPQTDVQPDTDFPELHAALEHQRRAYRADPIPDYALRIRDLKALSRMMRDHQKAIVAAISDDFGNRSRNETLFCEFFVVLDGIKDTIKHLKKWMRPQRRRIQMSMYPSSRNRVIPQPLGVVGVIVPWNFPANLTFGPLTSIFAAGNRAMVKLSENSPRFAQLLRSIASDYFAEDKLAFFEDSAGIGPAFSRLPFDHLLFTGSGRTGQAVMGAAATNLTPVTLELGGKSPAIVAPDFPIETAAERLLFWKLLNAGQICTTVDYLFLPEERVDAFVMQAKALVAKRYPDLHSMDYTAIIDATSHARLRATLDDARAQGAEVINLAPDHPMDDTARKFPPHLVLDASDDMQVMRREIFGPILPIKTYRDPQDVVDYVNGRDRPLALYPFTRDRSLQQFYIDRIMSGGVSVNNCLLHVGQHDLPFGGVGESGMGHYHGYEGFVTFSKLRPVFHQGPIDPLKMLMPPYGRLSRWLLHTMLRMAR